MNLCLIRPTTWGRRRVVVQACASKHSVGSILTGEMNYYLLIFSFFRSSNKAKRGIEFRTRYLKNWQKVRNGDS